MNKTSNRGWNLIAFFFFIPLLVEARTSVSSCDEFRREFPSVHLLVEDRGGYGDIAAAFSTVLALYEECRPEKGIKIHFAGEDSSFVSDKFRKLLLSRPDLEAYLLENPPHGYPSIVLSVAANHGEISSDCEENRFNHCETMILKIPVFSDSEQAGELGFSTVRYKGVKLKFNTPGLGENQTGFYPDLIARRYQDMTREELRQLMIRELIWKFGSAQIASLIENSPQMKIGVIYGVSSDHTATAFSKYIRGFSNRFINEPLVLMSPSSVGRRGSDERFLKKLGSMRERVYFHSTIPEKWDLKPGEIHVVETKTMPNALFTALLAYSSRNDIVPLGAGDGFLSAVMELGIPFALTQVDHNVTVVEDFKRHFESWFLLSENSRGAEEFVQLIRKTFGHRRTFFTREHYSDLEAAQELNGFKREFRDFSDHVPITLANWMQTAVYVKKNSSRFRAQMSESEVETIQDRNLRQSIRQMRNPLEKKTNRFLGLVISACDHVLGKKKKPAHGEPF